MSKQSGVTHPKAGKSVEDDDFDHATASWDLVETLAKDASEEDILETGMTLLTLAESAWDL